MIQELFTSTECGFREKFIKRLEEWKSAPPDPNSKITNTPPCTSKPILLSIPPSDDSLLDTSVTVENESTSVGDTVDSADKSIFDLNDLEIINYKC